MTTTVVTDWRGAPTIETAAVKYLLSDGRAEMLKVLKPQSCIAATRIGLDVLRAFGVEAKAAVVEATVYSPAAAAAIERGADEKELRAIPKAHVVVLGAEEFTAIDKMWAERKMGEDLPDGWKMHMVALVEGGILDLSLDQAQRPRYDIDVRPSYFRMDGPTRAAFARGDTVAWKDDSTGHVISYRWKKGDRTYERSPNWGARDRAVTRRMVGAMVRRIRAGWRRG